MRFCCEPFLVALCLEGWDWVVVGWGESYDLVHRISLDASWKVCCSVYGSGPVSSRLIYYVAGYLRSSGSLSRSESGKDLFGVLIVVCELSSSRMYGLIWKAIIREDNNMSTCQCCVITWTGHKFKASESCGTSGDQLIAISVI